MGAIAPEQAELNFKPAQTGRQTSEPAVWLLGRLANFSGWLSANELCQQRGLPATETARRFVRAWAAEAEPDVISGQPGYTHLSHATLEELCHFVNAMESQARKMTQRAENVRRRWHALAGAAGRSVSAK